MKKARSGSLGSITTSSSKPAKKSYFILSCPSSPCSSRNSDKRQADCIKQIDSLQKENFSLRLRLQFLERKAEDSDKDLTEILKHNEQLQNELRSRENELKSKEVCVNEIMKMKKLKEEGERSVTTELQIYNFNKMSTTQSMEQIDLKKDLMQKDKMILELEEKLANSENRNISLETSIGQRLKQAKDHCSALEAAFEKQRNVSENLSATCEELMKELQLKDEEKKELQQIICSKTNALEYSCKTKEELMGVIKEKEGEIRKLQELNRMLTEQQKRPDKSPADDSFRDRTQFTVRKPTMRTGKDDIGEGKKTMDAGVPEPHKIAHVPKESVKKTDGPFPDRFSFPEFRAQLPSLPPSSVENPYRERDFKLVKQNIDIFKRLRDIEEPKDMGSMSELNLASEINLTSEVNLLGSSNLIGDSELVVAQKSEKTEMPTFSTYWNYISSQNPQDNVKGKKDRK